MAPKFKTPMERATVAVSKKDTMRLRLLAAKKTIASDGSIDYREGDLIREAISQYLDKEEKKEISNGKKDL